MMYVIYAFVVLLQVFYSCDGRCDQGVYEQGVNGNEKNYIVNKHNELRLLIARGQLSGQPRGVNLKRMYWDDRLAAAAQNIANTCIYGHVKVIDSRWQVGQNIATNWDSGFHKGANWTGPIMNWWDEYKKYRYPNGFSMATGHYTQMAWDDTMYIGCGYTFFPINGRFKYQKIYVCNYGPAGNFPRAPYRTGNSGCENLC